MALSEKNHFTSAIILLLLLHHEVSAESKRKKLFTSSQERVLVNKYDRRVINNRSESTSQKTKVLILSRSCFALRSPKVHDDETFSSSFISKFLLLLILISWESLRLIVPGMDSYLENLWISCVSMLTRHRRW